MMTRRAALRHEHRVGARQQRADTPYLGDKTQQWSARGGLGSGTSWGRPSNSEPPLTPVCEDMCLTTALTTALTTSRFVSDPEIGKENWAAHQGL